jgi:hypothetical protein
LRGTAGGHLWFDLTAYRDLDPACRRLFLFVCKVFARRTTTPRLPLRHLGERVLGFSATLATRDLKAKVRRCVVRLADRNVVTNTSSTYVKHGRGDYSLTLRRGAYFERRRDERTAVLADESPVDEPLQAIGFDTATIRRFLRQYPHRLLQEWADITLAALERFGRSFFKKSPQAYFVDNVKHAAAGTRTPPDWWHDVRKSELWRRAQDGATPEASVLERIAAELPTSDAANVQPESTITVRPRPRTASLSSSRLPQSVGSLLTWRSRP